MSDQFKHSPINIPIVSGDDEPDDDVSDVIEIDGDSHTVHTDYDARRTAFLESRGLCVLRHANRDILNNLSGVYEHLQIQLETS